MTQKRRGSHAPVHTIIGEREGERRDRGEHILLLREHRKTRIFRTSQRGFHLLPGAKKSYQSPLRQELVQKMKHIHIIPLLFVF